MICSDTIRIPVSLSPERAEAELAKISAQIFAGRHEVPGIDDPPDESDEDYAAYAFLVRRMLAAEAAARAAYDACQRSCNPSPTAEQWETSRAAWAAYEEACDGYVRYRRLVEVAW